MDFGLCYYIAPLIGFCAMFAGGFWGLGGGWFVVPALMAMGVETPVAAGASLLQMLPSTFLTVLKQFKSIGWRKNSWGINIALPICGMAFIGGFFGCPAGDFLEAFFNSRKPQQCIYLVLLGFILYKTFMHKPVPLASEKGESRKPSWIKTGVIGFGVGVLSSLLGVGGGTITRPVMKSYLHVPEIFTGKIARLAVFTTALAGTTSYLLKIDTLKPGDPGTDSLIMGLLMASGGFIGFPLGAWLHSKVVSSGNGERAAHSFSYVVIMVIISLFFKIIDIPWGSRVTIFVCGIFLLAFLPAFTVWSQKHPIDKF